MPHLDPVASRRRWHLSLGLLLVLPGLVYAQAPAAPQTHTVRPGDTLWSLAQSYLGDPLLWPEIYRLNTDVVEDPHWIYPGETLRLAASENVKSVPAEDTPPPPSAVAQAPAADAAGNPPSAKVDAVEDPNFKETIGETADDYDPDAPLFPQMDGMKNAAQATVKAYSERNYRAVRRDEFYSGGFLSEEQNLPLGRVIGRTASPMIPSFNNFGVAKLYTELAISPPKNATYQVGDSLLIVEKGPQVHGYGYMVLPTGVGVVTRIDQDRPIMSVRQIFWSIYPGQWLLPLEKFPGNPTRARAMPITDGVKGKVIGWPRVEYIKLPQGYVYLDKGKEDGVALGDIWEVQRASGGIANNGTVLTAENMAQVQVVNVKDHKLDRPDPQREVRHVRRRHPDGPGGEAAAVTLPDPQASNRRRPVLGAALFFVLRCAPAHGIIVYIAGQSWVTPCHARGDGASIQAEPMPDEWTDLGHRRGGVHRVAHRRGLPRRGVGRGGAGRPVARASAQRPGEGSAGRSGHSFARGKGTPGHRAVRRPLPPCGADRRPGLGRPARIRCLHQRRRLREPAGGRGGRGREAGGLRVERRDGLRRSAADPDAGGCPQLPDLALWREQARRRALCPHARRPPGIRCRLNALLERVRPQAGSQVRGGSGLDLRLAPAREEAAHHLRRRHPDAGLRVRPGRGPRQLPCRHEAPAARRCA